MAADSLRDEAVELLQRLLRLNTVNPPGNETLAAELLRAYLEANGVEVELYSRKPERANLVARLRGGDGPSLCFLSHTDTVVADPAEWSRDPWAGDLATAPHVVVGEVARPRVARPCALPRAEPGGDGPHAPGRCHSDAALAGVVG